MISLKIQLFGGRGSRSGLGTGGPGIGIVDFISAPGGKNDIPLPENTGYPDFPDPDYTNYPLSTNDNFIKKTFDLLNYKRAEHDVVGEKYLRSLGINKHVKYSNENRGSSVGYIEYITDMNNIIYVTKYNLNKADTRRMEYKVKTMMHEGYHASNDSLKDPGYKLSSSHVRFHEETRTEMSALFLANKLNGYKYVPSYTLEVICAAAKYKRLPEYADCNTLYDLGEKFYKERMVKRSNPLYSDVENKFKTIKITDNYFKKYYTRIIKNKETYYESCKNSLFNYQYFNERYSETYKKSFDGMIEKIKQNKELVTGLEKRQFIMCVALSMNDGGIL